MSEAADIERRVLDLVAAQAGCNVLHLTMDTTLVNDLGFNGDKAATLMEWLQMEFDIDMSGFRFEQHFDPEGRPGWPWLLAAILAIPASVVLMVLVGTVSMVAGLQPGLLLGPGPMFALAYLTSLLLIGLTTIILPQQRARRVQKRPVTVLHLLQAARSRQWLHGAPEGNVK